MSFYRYKAKKGPVDIVEGRIEAESEKEAVEKINTLGCIPLRVEEEVLLKTPEVGAGRSLSKVKPRDITIFSRQMASLIRSGVPILRAISIITDQAEAQGLKSILQEIHSGLKEGAAFSSVLGRFPQAFPSLFIAMIRAGEDTGSLPESLSRIADYRRSQEEFVSRLRMALAYPLLMGVVGAATVVFMLTFVIPRLAGIFVNMGQSLPMPTKVLISMSKSLSSPWFWVFPALLWLVFLRQTKTVSGKKMISRLKIRLPIFGKIMLKADVSRFCSTLELLLKSGVPILRALDIASPVVNNEVIKEKLEGSRKELEQGGSFGRSLQGTSWLPAFVTNLITVGEESGKLPEALGEIAASYERETDEAVKIMTNLLEPLMILVMGAIVGFIVVAMLLPVFEINLMAK